MPETVLPSDFDGVFRFTNFTDTDFTAKWNSIAYTFPAMRTSPMIIPNATPEEVQHIRKKFAKELAMREFGKSSKYAELANIPIGTVPPTLTDDALTPFIQKCLEPLPLASIKSRKVPKVLDEDILKKDDEGNPVSRVMDHKSKVSLKGNGSDYVGE